MGFHPRRCGSPDARPPEQVLRYSRDKSRDGMGEQAQVSPSSYQPLESHIMEKEFS